MTARFRIVHFVPVDRGKRRLSCSQDLLLSCHQDLPVSSRGIVKIEVIR